MTRPPSDKLTITFRVPAAAAHLVRNHRQDLAAVLASFLDALTQAADTDDADARVQEVRQQFDDAKARFWRLGRAAYRIARNWSRAKSYVAPGGITRRRGNLPSGMWRRQVYQDLTQRFPGLGREGLEAAVSIYRRKFEAKLRARRRTTAVRLYLSGWTNSEIAERLGVSSAVVSNDLRNARDLVSDYRASHPDFQPIPRPERKVSPEATALTEKMRPVSRRPAR